MTRIIRFFAGLTVCFMISSGVCVAQSVVVPETVKNKCPDRAMGDKVKLAVARFSSSARGVDRRNLDNFSTMLSNALFEIRCFRMLSMIQDDRYNRRYGQDVKSEIAPHYIITGEITEYHHEAKEIKMGLIRKSTVSAHVGFILQIKDPVTREIVYSQSFNNDGQVSGTGITIRGNNVGNDPNNPVNKAFTDAFEKGILDAVTYIVDRHEDIYRTAGLVKSERAGRAAKEAAAPHTYTVYLAGVDFRSMSGLEKKLKSRAAVTTVSKTLNGRRGTLTVTMTGTIDTLAEYIQADLPGAEITGFEEDSLTVHLK